MVEHRQITDRELLKKIRHNELVLGGHRRLKIYGHLDCASGKRMKKENRLFFSSESEAINAGYRPCGHCMKAGYKKWKDTHGPL